MDKQETCQAKLYDDTPCGRPLYDDVHCIFHSEDIERKKSEFNDAFWEEFEKQKDEVYDFSGFIFPESIDFTGTKFEKDTYFFRAIFLGKNTSFSGATFSGEYTSFMGATFSGEYTSFIGATFSGENISFVGAAFSGKRTYFGRATFSGEFTRFMEATFSGDYNEFMKATFSSENTYFMKATFTGEDTSFSGATFSGKRTYFSGAAFLAKGTYFGDAIFSGEDISFRDAMFLGKSAHFEDATFSGEKIDFFNSHFNNVHGLFESIGYKTLLKRKYKIKDFRFTLGVEAANNYPLINRMTKDAWYLADFKRQHRIIYFFWWLLSDCGRVIWRWALLSLAIAITFGGIYADCPCLSWLKWIDCGQWLEKINPVMVIDQPNIQLDTQIGFIPRVKTWFTPFYFSIVTFTTLGFGDITPANEAGEMWLAFEVILGYIMLGGLISIFATKLARRS